MLAAIAESEQGGGYRFAPGPRAPGSRDNPRDPHYDGVRRDLWAGGERIARAAPDGATYCCGATLELWWTAWRAAGGSEAVLGEAERFVATWFCPVLGHAGAVQALVERGLGVEVGPAEARPGDLVQFWRSVDPACPSGHSAVFLGWEGDGQGARRLRYWSSQPATGGLGVHAEAVGPGWRLHLVRARHPADQ